MRGHHVYSEVWTPATGEILSLKSEPDNSHDQFSVAVMKNETVVGHVPRPASRLVFHFFSRDGHKGFCEIIGNRLNRGVNLGIEVPCIYRFYGGQRYIDRLNTLFHVLCCSWPAGRWMQVNSLLFSSLWAGLAGRWALNRVPV